MGMSEWQLAREESSRKQCAAFASPYPPPNTHTHTAPVLDLPLETSGAQLSPWAVRS